MARDPVWVVVRRLSVVAARAAVPTDRQLLERFTTYRDEDAFSTLVSRHGRLVWGACWRLLRHAQDAEDACQATFLVLARKAGTVRWHDSAANWLYGTALRVSAEVRSRNARNRACEQRARATRVEQPAPAATVQELCAALDDELNRLPERYRAPLLLCYLEGCTTDQAARQLGWSLRTLERRLAQGRELLRGRLTRRGLTLSAVLLAATLSGETALAEMPPQLTDAATVLVVSPAAGSGAPAALADAVMKGMTMWQSKVIAPFVLLAAVALGGGHVLLKADTPQPPAKISAPDPAPKVDSSAGAKKDDATPPGPASLASRVWPVMEVVQEKHFEPPARKDMSLAAAKALLKATGAAVPDDLARRAAGVTTEAQLAALFRELWPDSARAEPDRKVEAAALNGFLDSIPGRAAVHTESQVKIAEQLRGNRYVGVGIQLSSYDKEPYPQIPIPFRRGPARLAGAKPGDLIIEVDGKSAKDIRDLEKIVSWFRGEEGTTVTAVVRQPGATETRTLKMVRSVVPLDSVLSYRRTSEDECDYWLDRDAGIAYVWVKSIKSSTLHELRQVERRLRADDAKAIVLDLRFSVGEGNLHDVTLVADGLLDGGFMWSVRGKDDQVKEYRADREALFRGLPMVALINDIPDNCQALLLAALQDNDRAVLVGDPTNNDGLVRSRFTLPDGRNTVTVLTGRLQRANKDRSWPMRPDHAVSLDKDQRERVRKWLFDKELPELPAGTDDRPPEDPQLDGARKELHKILKDGGKR
jgi:C-terminal peptidase prc